MNIFTWTVLYLIMPIPVLFGAGLLFEGGAQSRLPRGIWPSGFIVIPTWLNALLTLPILGIFWFVLSKLPHSVKGYYAKDQAAADEIFNVRLAPLTEWWPLPVAILLYVTAVVVTGNSLRSRWLPERASALGRELERRRSPTHRRTYIGDGRNEWVWESDTPPYIGSYRQPGLRPPKPPKGPGGRWVKRR